MTEDMGSMSLDGDRQAPSLDQLAKASRQRATYDAFVRRARKYGYVPEFVDTATKDIKIFCVLHERRGEHEPSLHINTKPDGTVQAHCFGCGRKGDKDLWTALVGGHPLPQCQASVKVGAFSRITGGRQLISQFEIAGETQFLHWGNQYAEASATGEDLVEDTYFYYDVHGELDYAKAAFRWGDAKDFYWCRVFNEEPIPAIKRWSLDGATPPLYGEWTLNEQGREKEIVWAVEGEKDVDRLHGKDRDKIARPERAERLAVSLRIAGSIAEAVKVLEGRTVVVVPDNDKSGRVYAQSFVAQVSKLAGTTVKVVTVPGGDKSDVSDWLDAGGDFRELERMAAESASVSSIFTGQDEDMESPSSPEPASPAPERAIETTKEERDYEDALAEEVKRLRFHNNARATAKMEDDTANWDAPPADASFTLAQAKDREWEQRDFYIDGLFVRGHVVTLAGQKKVGKSTLVGNLMKSLADGEPFLNKFEVRRSLAGRVGVWNCEMEAQDFVEYLTRMQIRSDDRIVMGNLRDYRVNLMTDVGMQWTISWLLSREVEIWMPDPWSKMCAWAGVDENDNSQVKQLLNRIDEIKRLAGLGGIFMPVHPPRAANGQDGADVRGRGASALDEWPDELWMYLRDEDIRTLKVEGRGVLLEDTVLDFDHGTGLLRVNGSTRRQVKNDGAKDKVLEYIRANPGTKSSAIYDALGLQTAAASKAILGLETDGLIERVPGEKGAKLCYATDREAPARGCSALGIG